MKLLFRQRIFSWLDSYDIYKAKVSVMTVSSQPTGGTFSLIMPTQAQHKARFPYGILDYCVFRSFPQAFRLRIRQAASIPITS